MKPIQACWNHFHRQTLGILFIAVCVFCVLEGVGCTSKSQKKNPGVGDKIYPVSLQKVSREEIPDIVEVKGNFVPSDKLDVKAETEGKVATSPVTEGQMVNLGEALANINPEQLHLLLEKQKLELKEAEAKIEAGLTAKANALNATKAPFMKPMGARVGGTNPAQDPEQDQDQDNPTPPGNPDQVGEDLPPPQNPSPDKPDNSDALTRSNEITLDRIKAEMVLTEKKIETANITASIAGMLTKKNITDGSVVALGEVLFQIVKIDPIQLSVFVSKKDVGTLQKGERVDVKIDDMPDATLSGEINYIAAELDPQNKNYEVRISVPNTQLKIKAGMAGIATLPQTATRKALVVPESAIVTQENKKYVYVLEGQLAERREVEIGAKSDGKVEIKAGLKENEQVVSKGQATFKDESEFIKVE